jgi:hypothetical protein
VSDFVKTLTSGLWRFVYAWMLPAAITAGVFAVLVLPAMVDAPLVGHAAARFSKQSLLTQLAVVTAVAVSISILLALNSVPLYRVLEGYSWPDRLYKKRRERHIQKWKQINEQVKGGIDPNLGLLRTQLLWERFNQLPEKEDDILPTRLGNALKALETYAVNRYGFDSQTFWYELRAVVPESLRKDIDDAESVVDFFISFLYLSILFGLISLLIGVLANSVASIVAAIVALGLVPIFYLRAVKSTGEYKITVQALVNVGRPKLADTFALETPSGTDDERKMWNALTSFVFWGDEESKKTLDQYRIGKSADRKPQAPTGYPSRNARRRMKARKLAKTTTSEDSKPGSGTMERSAMDQQAHRGQM